MIRIVQCLCPSRHAIMAVAYHSEEKLNAAELLRAELEHLIATDKINPWCHICNSRDWTYEDAPTIFKTMDEARPFLAEQQRLNMAAREVLGNKN